MKHLQAVERRRWILPVAGLVCIGTAAFLLAYFTRRSGKGFLEGSPIIAAISFILYLLGVFFGARGLMFELRKARDVNAEDSPAFKVHPYLLAGAILLGACAGTTTGQMGALLSGFHRPGEPSVTHNAIQGPANPVDRANKIDEGLLVWSRYARPGLYPDLRELLKSRQQTFEKDSDAPITVLAWYFGLDSGLFVPAYFAVFGLLLILATKALRSKERAILEKNPKRVPCDYVSLARRAAILVVVAAATDQIENWTGITSTASAWFDGTRDLSAMKVSEGWATFLGAATLIKAACFVLTLICLIALGLYLLRNAAPERAGATSAAPEGAGATSAAPERAGATSADAERAGARSAADVGPWSGARGAWQSVLAVRIQVVAVVLFDVLMSLRIQAADTFRRWADHWWVAWVASFLVVAFALVVWFTARSLMALARSEDQTGSRAWARCLAVAAGVALILFGVAGGWAPTWGLLIPGGLVVILLILGWVASGVGERELLRPDLGSAVLPRLLGASVLAFFGLALLKASTGDVIYELMRGHGVGDLLILITIGLGFVIGSVVLYRRLSRPANNKARELSRPAASLALLSCVIVWMLFAAYLNSHLFWLTPKLGTAGVVAVFLILLTCTLSSAVAVAQSVSERPPAILRALGLRRTPVLSLVIAWALAVSLIPVHYPLSVTVPAGAGGVAAQGETLQAAFDAWVARNCLSARTTGPASTGPRTMPAVPLVIVSSSGGGVRAAVWTSYVMDQAFGFASSGAGCGAQGLATAPQDRNRSVFAASGISGGSLGLVSYAAQITAGPPSEPATDRIEQHLGQDSLAATLGWMFFVETPWAMVRFDLRRDRSEVLRESWERQWLADEPGLRQNFVDLRNRDTEIPLLILNGASAESGCRFNASMLKANGRDRANPVTGCLEPQGLEGAKGAVLPATIDLVDFLCQGANISLARAALFSARFPVISPPGEIQQCEDPKKPRPQLDELADPDPATFVVDGGYLEGSGTATALAIWNGLAPMVVHHNQDPSATSCIVPFFVQIDNSYLEPSGPGDTKAPPGLVGLQEAIANKNNRNGFTVDARQAAQVAFGQAFTLGGITVRGSNGEELADRYARFSPVAHPGATAPLGWTLSEASFRDLFGQFNKDQNRGSNEEMATWFDGLSCTINSP
jgi:hypothetical protein